MPVIVVANPKGGVGKTHARRPTWRATSPRAASGDARRRRPPAVVAHLAGAAARRRCPRSAAWEVSHDEIVRPPKGTTHVVLDTPAGLHGKRLDEVMRIADKVLVPLQPSIFDIQATHAFVRALLAHRRSDRDRSRPGRHAHARGHASPPTSCDHYLATLRVPLLAFLRDTQNYVHLAAHGLTLWDVASSRVERDLEQWAPLQGMAGPMKHFAHLDDLRTEIGREVGVSDWITVDAAAHRPSSRRPPATTSGSTSTPRAPRPGRSARRSRTASSR